MGSPVVKPREGHNLTNAAPVQECTASIQAPGDTEQFCYKGGCICTQKLKVIHVKERLGQV